MHLSFGFHAKRKAKCRVINTELRQDVQVDLIKTTDDVKDTDDGDSTGF